MLLAQLQKVAGAREKLLMVDRAVKEIGGAGLKRTQPEFSFLVNRNDNDGNFSTIGLRAEAADEFRTIHCRHFEIGDDQIGCVVLEPGKELRRVAEAVHRHARFYRRRKFRENLAVSFPIVENDNLYHAS